MRKKSKVKPEEFKDLLGSTLGSIDAYFDSRRKEGGSARAEELGDRSVPGLASVDEAAARDVDHLLNIIERFVDIQNGPPLEKYRAQWEALMFEANVILASSKKP